MRTVTTTGSICIRHRMQRRQGEDATFADDWRAVILACIVRSQIREFGRSGTEKMACLSGPSTH